MAERKIKITAGAAEAEAVLNDSATADSIWNALPISARANVWGDEIYFSIPVSESGSADAREVVESGELGYWPPGNAFCVFFGLTPASRGGEIRAASPVNPVGRVSGDAKIFKKTRAGDSVTIDKA
ncbi:MAG TPA: cyclophilin-like fold protein [bacterium]|nr:cyclophilin-like fold protein [bacterium]HPI78306.1 cyclophilin-like fold protein [bacterium]HPN95558.1 cyclophilin-like fold protein [bacterium]